MVLNSLSNMQIFPALFSLVVLYAFTCNPAFCDTPQLIAQYSSSQESTTTAADSTVPASPTPTTTANSPAPTDASPTSNEGAIRAPREQLQHQRDQQFLRLLLIGVFIFFAAIAFAGYLSIPRRKQEENVAAGGTSNAD